MEDDEAADLIKTVNRTLLDEPQKYNIYSYLHILFLNIIFNRIGILSIDLDDIVERMKNNIKYFNIESNFIISGWRSQLL